MALRRQTLRHVRRDAGLLAVAGSFSRGNRERHVDGGLGRLPAPFGLLDLRSRRAFAEAIPACSFGRPGVRVHAVLSVAVDADMTRGFDRPKASPESVARGIFDGVESGEEELFPDPRSASMAESWRSGSAKALERQYAALVEPASVEA